MFPRRAQPRKQSNTEVKPIARVGGAHGIVRVNGPLMQTRAFDALCERRLRSLVLDRSILLARVTRLFLQRLAARRVMQVCTMCQLWRAVALRARFVPVVIDVMSPHSVMCYSRFWV